MSGDTRAVIFDLDGTLADTSADLIAAANACLDTAGQGAPLDPVGDALTAFHGGRAMLRLGLSRRGVVDEARVDALFDPFIALYAAGICRHTRLYDGVEAALDRLAGAGYALGVCTNKPEALAEDLLGRLGIRDRFGAMLGADTLPVRKPDPEHLWETIRRVGGVPGRAVLVGDTKTDRGAARNAGVACLLVSFGPEGAGVAALEPEGMLAHYDEIDAEVARLIG